MTAIEAEGDFEADFGWVVEQLEDDTACYMMVRTDDDHPKGNGYEWVFVSYVPDTCPVRHKMLYASTRDTTKKQLGENAFTKELHGTLPEELSWEGYQAYLAGAEMSDYDLLSLAEKEKLEEARMEIHTGVGRAGVHGVSFPLTAAASEKVSAFASGSISYVQLCLDLDAETIDLAEADSVAVADLGAKVPDDSPRYHLFRYSHDFEGEAQEPILFFYSCPLSSKIKERMLYSSCKEAAISYITEAGVSVDKKLEITEGADIDTDFVHTTFHPPEKESKIKFAKPTVQRRRPQRRKKRT